MPRTVGKQRVGGTAAVAHILIAEGVVLPGVERDVRWIDTSIDLEDTTEILRADVYDGGIARVDAEIDLPKHPLWTADTWVESADYLTGIGDDILELFVIACKLDVDIDPNRHPWTDPAGGRRSL